MPDDGMIAFFLVLVLFVVQPVLLAVAAAKAYRRSGTLWGFLAFVINAGIFAFFESQFNARGIIDGADQVGMISIISAVLILALLELKQNDPQSAINKDLFRRGVSRVWACVSGGWIILCAFEFTNIPGNCYVVRCGIFVRTFFKVEGYSVHPSYFDVGKAFIGVPILAFAVALAACWIADGFRRSTPKLPPPGNTENAAPQKIFGEIARVARKP